MRSTNSSFGDPFPFRFEKCVSMQKKDITVVVNTAHGFEIVRFVVHKGKNVVSRVLKILHAIHL